MNLWIDADPSGLTLSGLDCDDDLAILMALSLAYNSSFYSQAQSTVTNVIKLKGISICGGNAPLSHTTRNAQRLLRYVATKFIPSDWSISPDRLPSGIGWRDMNVAWRSLRLFNFVSPDTPSSNDAAEAIIRAVQATKAETEDESQVLTVLMLGPPSNLAKATQLQSWQPSRLQQHAVLMGGELTQQRMDLNFMSDRAAARTIIGDSTVQTTIVPIQTCGQVVVTSDLLDRFEHQCCPRSAACALLPKMRQQVRWMPGIVNTVVEKRFVPGSRWHPSSNLQKGFIPWDVVSLLATVRPGLFDEWEWHEVSLPSCVDGEPCSGTMTVGPGQVEVPDTYAGWVRIPHVVKNETELLEMAFLDLACTVEGRSMKPPPSFWGFLVHAASILLGTLFVLTMGLYFAFCRKCLTKKKKEKIK